MQCFILKCVLLNTFRTLQKRSSNIIYLCACFEGVILIFRTLTLSTRVETNNKSDIHYVHIIVKVNHYDVILKKNNCHYMKLYVDGANNSLLHVLRNVYMISFFMKNAENPTFFL